MTTFEQIYPVSDQGYRDAYQAWIDYYEATEMVDRRGVHSPPRHRGGGVMPRYGGKLDPRPADIRDLSRGIAAKMTLLDAGAVERARRDALAVHERWCRENPCPCDRCKARWP